MKIQVEFPLRVGQRINLSSGSVTIKSITPEYHHKHDCEKTMIVLGDGVTEWTVTLDELVEEMRIDMQAIAGSLGL